MKSNLTRRLSSLEDPTQQTSDVNESTDSLVCSSKKKTFVYKKDEKKEMKNNSPNKKIVNCESCLGYTYPVEVPAESLTG